MPPLFQQEGSLLELTPEERYTKWRELENPVLGTGLVWAASKSPLGKAQHDLRGQRSHLERYLEDGSLELSNPPGGPQFSAKINSVIEAAKGNGLDP